MTSHGVKRIVTGLLSGSGQGGIAAEGPVSVSRGPDGTFYGQFGLNSHEVPPAGAIPANLRAAALAELGHLPAEPLLVLAGYALVFGFIARRFLPMGIRADPQASVLPPRFP